MGDGNEELGLEVSFKSLSSWGWNNMDWKQYMDEEDYWMFFYYFHWVVSCLIFSISWTNFVALLLLDARTLYVLQIYIYDCYDFIMLEIIFIHILSL